MYMLFFYRMTKTKALRLVWSTLYFRNLLLAPISALIPPNPLSIWVLIYYCKLLFSHLIMLIQVWGKTRSQTFFFTQRNLTRATLIIYPRLEGNVNEITTQNRFVALAIAVMRTETINAWMIINWWSFYVVVLILKCSAA